MATDNRTPSREEIDDRLQDVGRYTRLVRAGLAVIVTAFLVALAVILPADLESPAQAVEPIPMPLTFVGLGLILYGIRMHLYLMHLNLVRQLQPEESENRP